MAGAGPGIRWERRGNVVQATPADQRQPRLVVGACLIVAFEDWCVLTALTFLWAR